MSKLVEIIDSADLIIRNTPIEDFCSSVTFNELIVEITALEEYRKRTENLYKKVRANFFLYAIYRFYLPNFSEVSLLGEIPYNGYLMLLERRFEEAIEIFKSSVNEKGYYDGIAIALASGYHSLGFQLLSDQVRKSVRSVKGNQWMFRIGHPADHPLSINKNLIPNEKLSPILTEATPVRMDLSHSGWSDIFFLGMDFPEGAKVLNVSIDLSILNKKNNSFPEPPIKTYLRVIDKPVLRLVSTDLEAIAEINSIDELFDFSKDYLGLLKAGIIASGIVPPGMEGAANPISELFAKIIKPGYGIELITSVNGIPKGSRLAVSTNLLASIISVCMRATGQTKSLTGPLLEDERKIIAARAILGEWLGGSGGGWQDSGGIWDGIKIIEGAKSKEGDPEFDISYGTLLPNHKVLDEDIVSNDVRKKLHDSLVLVHGGMAQDVGPILEMVTEKYLLRSSSEWESRKKALEIFDDIVASLKNGDIKNLGYLTNKNFKGPIQDIIPWASNYFTELLIDKVKNEYGEKFYGFWMLGGMSGGGMGFMFAPGIKAQAQMRLKEMMLEIKSQLQSSVQFSIDPVVYDFKINNEGTSSRICENNGSVLPNNYYTLIIPEMLKKDRTKLSRQERLELDQFGSLPMNNNIEVLNSLFNRLLPGKEEQLKSNLDMKDLLKKNGFDPISHEQLKADLRSGRIGIAQNRLPSTTSITNVNISEIFNSLDNSSEDYFEIGNKSIQNGEVAVVTLAGGAGSRWTKGAGVVKSLNPFVKFNSKFRSFIEIQLAKSKMLYSKFNIAIPHIFTTSYLTEEPIRNYLKSVNNFGYKGEVIISTGKYVGLRLLPTIKDLKYQWEETTQQLLDEQEQKVLESTRKAIMYWVDSMGEVSDYTDNMPLQCLHPVGHWYEFPTLIKNGTLKKVLDKNNSLKYLLLHNIDTLGVNIDPKLLGYHISSKAALTAEVINKRIDDSGGGLAKVNGNIRLVEGMALPDEKIEFDLSFYNSATNWIDIDQVLNVFNLTREDLSNQDKIEESIRSLSNRVPTYITLKDVKKRWGKGQEDIYPLLQFEKLWGDMTALSELNCKYILVSRNRGQQLKDPAQLDGWFRDGSAEYVNSLCKW